MKATGSFLKAAILCKSEEKPRPKGTVLDWIRNGFQFPGKPAPNPEPKKECGAPFPVPPPPKPKPDPEAKPPALGGVS